MQKIICLVLVTMFASCSTFSPKTDELQQAQECKVWKDGALGSKTVITVEGELAKQQQTCWIMNMWGCTYTDYTFNGKNSEIKSSLPPEDKVIARLEGNKITSINMTGITADPIELKANRADYAIKGPIGPKQNMSVEYNKNCSKRQAALGLLAMIAK